MPISKIPNSKSPYQGNLVNGAEFVIGAEGTNTINVAVQLKDGTQNIGVAASVFVYVSDDADGDGVSALGPATSIAIGTKGVAIPLVAKKALQVISESDGSFDLTLTETGAKTFYLVVVLPDGQLVVSGAIAFAA